MMFDEDVDDENAKGWVGGGGRQVVLWYVPAPHTQGRLPETESNLLGEVSSRWDQQKDETRNRVRSWAATFVDI